MAALVLAATPAFADTSGNVTQNTKAEEKNSLAIEMETIQVLGQVRRTRTEDSDSYTTAAMRTATGLPLSSKETPQSVSVVTRKRMDDQNLKTVDEALAQTTGVNILKAHNQVQFQSRGFTMSNVQEDGVNRSWTTYHTGTAEASQGLINTAVYDHLEVVRGATGLMQGSGQPGGTVNMVRKRPTNTFRGYLQGSVGSWDHYTIEGDISGPINKEGTLRGRMVTQLGKQGSFTDYMKGNNQLFYGVLSYDLSDNTMLTAGVEWSRSRSKPNWYGVPLAADGSDLGLSRSTYLSPAWSNARYRKFNSFAELNHHFNDDWKLDLSLNYIRSTGDIKSSGLLGDGTNNTLNGIGSNGLSTMQIFQNRHNTARQFGAKLNVTGKYSLLGYQHDVMMGVDYAREVLDNTRLGQTESTRYNVYAFDPTAIAEPDWSRSNRQNNYHYRINQHSFYLATRLNLADRAKLILGSRYTRYVLKDQYTDLRTNRVTYTGELRENGQLVPYAGLVWDITPDTSSYVSYTDIFEPVNARGYDGQTLGPRRGNNYEVGVKTSLFDNTLNVSASLYRTVHKNRNVTVRLPSGQTTPDGRTTYSAPAGRVRSQGFELEVDGALTPNWHLFAGYTFNTNKYMNAENTSTRVAGAIYSPHTPKHTLRLYTNYRLPNDWSRWKVGLGVTAQSRMQTIRQQYTTRRSGYALWNADVSYQASKNLQFSLHVGNLFNKRYYTDYDNFHRGGNNYFGEPRSITARAKWTF